MLIDDILRIFGLGVTSGILIGMVSFGGGWAISQLIYFFKSLIQ